MLLLAPPFGAARAHAQVTALVAGNQLVVGGDGAANQITLRVFLLDPGKIQVLTGAPSSPRSRVPRSLRSSSTRSAATTRSC